jgi:hypothetical protein
LLTAAFATAAAGIAPSTFLDTAFAPEATSLAPAGTSLCVRPALFNTNLLSPEIFAMHLFDGVLGFVRRRHYDKTKSPRFVLACVHYNRNGGDIAEALKGLAHILFGCLSGQVSYKDLHSVS